MTVNSESYSESYSEYCAKHVEEDVRIVDQQRDSDSTNDSNDPNVPQ
jgi:hypothetical protein